MEVTLRSETNELWMATRTRILILSKMKWTTTPLFQVFKHIVLCRNRSVIVAVFDGPPVGAEQGVIKRVDLVSRKQVVLYGARSGAV